MTKKDDTMDEKIETEKTEKHDKKHKEKKPTELELLQQKNEELTKTMQYVQAEFQNYKNRVERDRSEHAQSANKSLILNIIPVIDTFELAIKSANDHKKERAIDEEFLKGTELIYAQLLDILKKEGLKQIKSLGETFDPYKHECLMQTESEDSEPNKVVEVFQKGYALNDKIIRHAKVKVSK
jgi:molecular chaperone GrpE